MKRLTHTMKNKFLPASMNTIASRPPILSALLVSVTLLVLVLTPSLVAADTNGAGGDEHGHDEAATTAEPSGLVRLLENRVIYLIGSLVLITLMTWAVFLIVRIRPPSPPSPNNQAPESPQ